MVISGMVGGFLDGGVVFRPLGEPRSRRTGDATSAPSDDCGGAVGQ